MGVQFTPAPVPQGVIQNFEEQSGGGGIGGFTPRTYVRITNITGIPEPEVIPYSASPTNVTHVQTIKKEQKAAKRRAASVQTQTLEAVNSLSSQMSSMTSSIVQAIQKIPVPTPSPSPLGGVNWTPIIQGVITAVAPALGLNMNTSPPNAHGETQGYILMFQGTFGCSRVHTQMFLDAPSPIFDFAGWKSQDWAIQVRKWSDVTNS